MNNTVGETDISKAVRHLNLAGKPVCLHSSLRSFGSVAGGAETVLRGFLAEGCTVMVPTFTYEHELSPPLGQRPQRNGFDYADPQPLEARPIYTTESREISEDMGAIPRALLDLPEHVRGDHPLDSFTAVGPSDDALISGQTSLDVYAPFQNLTLRAGYVVLMGVGLTRMTLLHYAEQEAGRELFWRWANDKSGAPVSVRVGGCSEGFEELAPALAELERTLHVGSSFWRIYPAKEALAFAAATIRAEPHITHCPDGACERCNDAVRGGPRTDPEFEQRMVRTWR